MTLTRDTEPARTERLRAGRRRRQWRRTRTELTRWQPRPTVRTRLRRRRRTAQWLRRQTVQRPRRTARTTRRRIRHRQGRAVWGTDGPLPVVGRLVAVCPSSVPCLPRTWPTPRNTPNRPMSVNIVHVISIGAVFSHLNFQNPSARTRGQRWKRFLNKQTTMVQKAKKKNRNQKPLFFETTTHVYFHLGRFFWSWIAPHGSTRWIRNDNIKPETILRRSVPYPSCDVALLLLAPRRALFVDWRFPRTNLIIYTTLVARAFFNETFTRANRRDRTMSSWTILRRTNRLRRRDDALSPVPGPSFDNHRHHSRRTGPWRNLNGQENEKKTCT